MVLPAFTRIDARHQPGLIIDGIGEVFIRNVRSQYDEKCIENVVFNVHTIFLQRKK